MYCSFLLREELWSDIRAAHFAIEAELLHIFLMSVKQVFDFALPYSDLCVYVQIVYLFSCTVFCYIQNIYLGVRQKMQNECFILAEKQRKMLSDPGK